MTSRTRTIANTAVAALIVAALALGWSMTHGDQDEPPATALVPYTSATVEGLGSAAGIATYTIGGICLRGTGPVRITSVDLRVVKGRGDVEAFSVFPTERVRRNPGTDVLPISAMGYLAGSHVVERACPTGTDPLESLAVEIHRRGRTDLESAGMRIHYESNGRSATVDAPYGIALCRSETRSCGSDELADQVARQAQ